MLSIELNELANRWEPTLLHKGWKRDQVSRLMFKNEKIGYTGILGVIDYELNKI